MSTENLKVHDIKVSNATRLAGGKAIATTTVTFYVGSHGPFDRDFTAPANKPADIQAVIQQQVHDLAQIVNREY